MNTAEQDSRLMYSQTWMNDGYPYPENTEPWEWLVAFLDLGSGSAAETAVTLGRWIEFVKDAHTNRTKSGSPQTRQDGSPYYYHPIRIAMLAGEHFDPMGRKAVEHPERDIRRLDWQPLCYAFFGHDLWEDTKATRREVIDVLGKGLGVLTCDLITAVTKPEKTEDQRSGIGHFRYTHGIYSKYAFAPTEVQLLKGFDRLGNLKDMQSGAPLAFRRRYLEDTSLLLSYLRPPLGVYRALTDEYWTQQRAFWDSQQAAWSVG
jgi:(p)ppGpp synthase/HD superfamily hydrolase